MSSLARGNDHDEQSAATERESEYVNVQVGFWKSLWLVLRGARVRRWETWEISVESLLDEDDYAVMAMEESDEGVYGDWRDKPGNYGE